MSDARTLTITRVFAAPRDLVFTAWIDPQQAAQWWGPKGFTSVSCTMDARVGGTWRRAMRSPDDTEYCTSGTYREIVPPQRLVFTYAFEDAAGQRGHETLVTLTFTDLDDGRTELRLHQALFKSMAARDEHDAGWSGCLDRFAAYLAAQHP